MMGLTAELIQKCDAIDYNNLPKAVVDRTKYLFLDYLGVAARGALSKSARSVQKMVTRLEKDTTGAIIIGTNLSSSPPSAALANGIASHSIEMDDVVNAASLHPAVTVMSTALASGHQVECNGRKLIEGIVAGYEVAVRLGIGLDPSAHYSRGFHPTATCGTMGSAITAAKILNLSPAEMAHSLGIAGSQAAGSMEFLTDGTLTKQFHGGWAAHSGLIAALLAREGFTGPGTIVEGTFGFLNAYSPRPNFEHVLMNWGQPFQVLKTSIKPHSCCRYKQGPIDGILRIISENHLKASDIESVTLGILKAGFPIIAIPEETKRNPRTIVDAQFSMPFGAAVAILNGKATLDEYTPENLNNPNVREMMSRVRCIEDPELEKAFPEKWPATVTIKTSAGRKCMVKIDYPKGDPENPLSWDELIEKFKWLVEPVFTNEQRDRIVDQVCSLENLDRLDDLLLLLKV